ncbi:hypothetical protein [Natronomonas sp.]|uniref:hypothetical protein n=1 Tax=Natronomonas sp. TaxID=2184060 RepID=UPI00398939BA
MQRVEFFALDEFAGGERLSHVDEIQHDEDGRDGETNHAGSDERGADCEHVADDEIREVTPRCNHVDLETRAQQQQAERADQQHEVR